MRIFSYIPCSDLFISPRARGREGMENQLNQLGYLDFGFNAGKTPTYAMRCDSVAVTVCLWSSALLLVV